MVPMPSTEVACGVYAWEAAARALPHPVHRGAGWLVVDWGTGFGGLWAPGICQCRLGRLGERLG